MCSMCAGWGAPLGAPRSPLPPKLAPASSPSPSQGVPNCGLGWAGLSDLSPVPPCAPVTCTRLYAADIVFLLDGSSSIGRSNFREVRGFLEGLVMPFSGAASAQGVRFAAVQYSDDPR